MGEESRANFKLFQYWVELTPRANYDWMTARDTEIHRLSSPWLMPVPLSAFSSADKHTSELVQKHNLANLQLSFLAVVQLRWLLFTFLSPILFDFITLKIVLRCLESRLSSFPASNSGNSKFRVFYSFWESFNNVIFGLGYLRIFSQWIQIEWRYKRSALEIRDCNIPGVWGG